MNEFQKMFLDILIKLDMVYRLNGNLVFADADGPRGIDDIPGSADEVSPHMWGNIFMRAVYLNPSLFAEVIPDKAFSIHDIFHETFWDIVNEVASRRVVSQS